MFFGTDLHHAAVWSSKASVNAAVRMIRQSARKYDVISSRVYRQDGTSPGWVVFICDFSDGWHDDPVAVTKGYIAALMQRHDIPLPDPKANPDACVQIAPQFRFTPMFDELPKIGPSCIHVAW